MLPEYERLFVLMADHQPKRLRDLYGCVDFVDNDSAMQQRVRRLVHAVASELNVKQHQWAIAIKQRKGQPAVYLLVERAKLEGQAPA